MSNYKGVIIEESLDNASMLKDVKVLKTEVVEVTERHKTPWIKQWTMHTVEIPEEKVEDLAERISLNLDNQHSAWYVDFKNDDYHFIVYKDKIFKVNLKNPFLYQEAQDYGISLGIPEYQVDFVPEK